MKTRVLLALVLAFSASAVQAASGTPEQQAACRPDVRRFCHHIQQGAGDDVFLSCLQANRAKLSPRCRQVLESNGV